MEEEGREEKEVKGCLDVCFSQKRRLAPLNERSRKALE